MNPKPVKPQEKKTSGNSLLVAILIVSLLILAILIVARKYLIDETKKFFPNEGVVSEENYVPVLLSNVTLSCKPSVAKKLKDLNSAIAVSGTLYEKTKSACLLYHSVKFCEEKLAEDKKSLTDLKDEYSQTLDNYC